MKIVYENNSEQCSICIAEKQSFSNNSYNILTEKEKAVYNSFQANNRKVEFLITREILQYILDNNYSPINYLSSGKPTLHNSNISISHSSNFATVIVSKKLIVGIDIEEYRPNIIRIKDKFLSEDELSFLHTTEDLILAWSAKETLFKLNDFSPDFKAHYRIIEIGKSNIQARLMKESFDKTIDLQYFRTDKYCLTWCCSPQEN